jgi:hypothetical protein
MWVVAGTIASTDAHSGTPQALRTWPLETIERQLHARFSYKFATLSTHPPEIVCLSGPYGVTISLTTNGERIELVDIVFGSERYLPGLKRKTWQTVAEIVQIFFSDLNEANLMASLDMTSKTGESEIGVDKARIYMGRIRPLDLKVRYIEMSFPSKIKHIALLKD